MYTSKVIRRHETKTITIAPVTRIEGHAKVTINLDDSGNVADTFVNVVELRGFGKFCIGRPIEELPRIVTSISGAAALLSLDRLCPFGR